MDRPVQLVGLNDAQIHAIRQSMIYCAPEFRIEKIQIKLCVDMSDEEAYACIDFLKEMTNGEG